MGGKIKIYEGCFAKSQELTFKTANRGETTQRMQV
jgi:hypothetical protein